MSGFSPEWLKLREPADLAARNARLARRFAAFLPRIPGRPVRLVDLGAGTGANCRALMPRIGGDQEWIVVDRDPRLLEAQGAEMVRWARRQGYPILAGGGRITITVGTECWRVSCLERDLARNPAGIEDTGAAGVTAAAFFDLVSRSWVETFASFLARRSLPLFAALTVDGTRVWEPPLPEDAAVTAAFADHQRRDKGFGPALGGAAPTVLGEALAHRGFTVEEAASDWHLAAADEALLAELVAGEAAAALEADPAAVAAWKKKRLDLLKNGRLRLTVGHRDLLAFPGGAGNMGS